MSLKPCRECGTAVSTEAPTCPKCGVKNPIRKTSMVILLAGFFVLFVVCVSVSRNGPKTGGDTTSAVAAPRPVEKPIEVPNTQLWNEYEANEVAADEKYKGKRLLVAGVVDSIDKDVFNNVVLHLRSPNQCHDHNGDS